ncbi:phage head closure protein [Bacillus pseudomycoides]|uniref:phage head closure protein n=1 Tax=Bacillus pseudomycoides TaxID=64104 RepID=UPI000BF0815B|nr:phage head closure protein [Bacillus pseudomycoides]PEN09672.1 hypothetical protein CN640_11520 [Bacillus pseudomycoides]PFW97652.1 hypothetical protein COL29_02400 [Bacillus pseudomycoides]
MPSIKSSVGNSKRISLDDVCFLISVENEKDDLGQVISTNETERQIFCSKLSISRQEFLAGGQLGLKPQIIFVVDSDEYDDETSLKYENQKYTVYRIFPRFDGYTEVYCEVKAGG